MPKSSLQALWTWGARGRSREPGDAAPTPPASAEPQGKVLGGRDTDPYDGFAPEAPPVLQPPDAAAGAVADGAARADRQVALQPLVGHGHLRRGCGRHLRATTAQGWPPPPRDSRCHLPAPSPPGGGGPAARDPPRAHPVLVLDDFRADGGQRGPLAVVGGPDGAALVGLELAHLGGKGGRVRTAPQPHGHGIAPQPPPGADLRRRGRGR